MQQEKQISITCRRKMIRTAYLSKQHKTDFHDIDKGDGYFCKLQLSGGVEGITLVANFLSDVYAFPLYSEIWFYDNNEEVRATMKVDYEENGLIAPNLQAVAREALRFVDIDRKKRAPSRSLEAAKFEERETDWRKTIYGPRYPKKETPVTERNDRQSVTPVMSHNITSHVKIEAKPHRADRNVIPMSINNISKTMSPLQAIAQRDEQESSRKGLIRMQQTLLVSAKQQEEDRKKTENSSYIPMSANRIII
jgi:hypothetical protein